MIASKTLKRITLIFLAAGVVTLTAVKFLRAQHDLGAENTHHLNYSSV